MTSAKTPAKIPPKPGKEVVYLDVDDDITTVVDKVEGAQDKIVALVLPKRFATLQSIVNMRLLKRSADSANKNVVLITSEHKLLPLAGAADIHVAKNLQSKPEIPPAPVDSPAEKPKVSEDPDAELDGKDAKLDYHRSIGSLAATSAVDDPETIPLEDGDEEKKAPVAKKPARNKKLKVPNFERFRLLLVLGAVSLVALIVFLVMALFVWPKAVVTLQTEATPLDAVFELNASDQVKALEVDKGNIPAALKTSDLKSEQKAQATGEQNNGNKATGSVTLTAKRCPPNIGAPSAVPAGTGVSTGGLFFITQSNASFSFDGTDGTCNNWKSNSVTITAQAAGAKYNVSNASFSVSGRSDVSATGSASGGTDDIKKVLSQNDVNNAANRVTEDDKKRFIENFKKELDAAGLYLIESTFKPNDPVITANPAVGAATDESTVSIKITYSVLTLQKTDLSQVVADKLNKQLDKSKQKISNEDVLQSTTVTVQSQKSPSVATLSVSSQNNAVAVIDTDSIKQQIGGKKEGEIKNLLAELPGVKNVEVRMSPFWVSKVPKSAGKVTIIQQPLKTNNNDGS